MCYEAELSLDSRSESIRLGREFVARALTQWGVMAGDGTPARADEIILVASELLTNAVRASTGTTGLRIEAHRDHVVVAVRDDSPAQVVARSAGISDTSGRGLAIVEALSDRWGTTTPTGGPGKVVWSRMAITAPSALSEQCRL